MSKTGFAADHLRSFIERVERLEEEKAALAADIREVYSEAKGSGFDTKIMRKVVALRKLDKADFQEQEAMRDLYMSALGMLGDTPLGAAAIAKASAPKRQSVNPETGEVIESPEPRSGAKVHLSVTVDDRVAKILSDAPRPFKRDVSTSDEPSSEVGPQAEASLAGTGTETPADREGRSSEGEAFADEAATVDRHVSASPPRGEMEIPEFLLRKQRDPAHA